MTDSDEVKLLPCPFCGSTAELHRSGTSGNRRYWRAYCPNCDGLEDLPGKEAAIARWNKRTRPPVVTDEVVERVARAIALSDYSSENIVWPGDFSPQERIDYYDNARAALTAMPAVVSGGQSLDDYALPPSGLSQSTLSQSETAAAIAREK